MIKINNTTSENKISIKIEDVDYHIRESWLSFGTGYTFNIYDSLEYNKTHSNYFCSRNNNRIVIVGKLYNYLLIREDNSSPNYNITLYEKTILKLQTEKINNYNFFSIFLNGDLISRYGGEPYETWGKEKYYINKNLRKQKINKIINDILV